MPVGQLLPGARRRLPRRGRGAARGRLHRVVQRLPHGEPPPGRDAPRPRRLVGHRHHGDPAGRRGRGARRGDGRLGRQARGVPGARCRGARQLPRAGLRRARCGRPPTAAAPTSSSTTWAPRTSPATSTSSPPAGGSSSSGCRAGPGRARPVGALLRKRAAVIATSLRARPAAEKATIVAAVREHVWPLVAQGRVRAGRPRDVPARRCRRGPPRARGERPRRQGPAHHLTARRLRARPPGVARTGWITWWATRDAARPDRSGRAACGRHRP